MLELSTIREMLAYFYKLSSAYRTRNRGADRKMPARFKSCSPFVGKGSWKWVGKCLLVLRNVLCLRAKEHEAGQKMLDAPP